jgi:hypothetical protein
VRRRGKGRATARRGGGTCGDDARHRGGAASQGLLAGHSGAQEVQGAAAL